MDIMENTMVLRTEDGAWLLGLGGGKVKVKSKGEKVRHKEGKTPDNVHFFPQGDWTGAGGVRANVSSTCHSSQGSISWIFYFFFKVESGDLTNLSAPFKVTPELVRRKKKVICFFLFFKKGS